MWANARYASVFCGLMNAGNAFSSDVFGEAPLFPTIVTDVPGRQRSGNYGASVFSNGSWTAVFVFETQSQASSTAPTYTNGYFSHLENWTASWVSSQRVNSGEALQLRVWRIGRPIVRAKVHPVSSPVSVENVSADGVVTLVAHANARVAIDFDGAFDEVDTGPSYVGPALNSFCWFIDDANTTALPDPLSPSSIIVRPGDALPNASAVPSGSTIIFAPGVHRATYDPSNPMNWTVIHLSTGSRYFLCAGAVVYASFAADYGGAGVVVTIDGYGVLSGEEMNATRTGNGNTSPLGMRWSEAINSTLAGITFVDHPNHHMILDSASRDTKTCVLSNVKVLGWRSNGDGVHVFGSWIVRDLFLRTQDDSMYLTTGENTSTAFSGVTTWNDANGCAFVFCVGGGNTQRVSTLRDSVVIYQRASWAWWPGGRIFSARGANNGTTMSGVAIDGVHIEDTLPTFNAWNIDWVSTSDSPVANATFSDISFSNIAVANWSTVREDFNGAPLPFGIPNLLFAAGTDVTIRNVAFNNCTIAGAPLSIPSGLWNASSAAGNLINVTIDGSPLF